MLIQHALIFRCPREILVEIAVDLALVDPIGPPADLLSLLLTCRQMYHSLRPDRQLFARIFHGQFDTRAAPRRLGQPTMWTQHLTAQLERNWLTLRAIRTGDIYAEHLEEYFWMAFLMCLENDGRNEAQLSWANLDGLLEQYLETRLMESRGDYQNWPAESAINSLAIWLYWLRLDDAKLASMSEAQRSQLKDLIRAYTFTTLRYPCFFAPDNHFTFPLSHDMSGVAHLIFETPHGYYPVYRQPTECVETIEHRGASFQIAEPLLGLGAKLLYMTLDERPLDVNSTALVDRAHALQLGVTGVRYTQADVIEANSRTAVQLLPPGDWDWRSKLVEAQREGEGGGERGEARGAQSGSGAQAKSAALDELWDRMLHCWNPYEEQRLRSLVYIHGTMSGLWKGRMLTPDVGQYFALVRAEACPADLSAQNPRVMTMPVYMNLREWHCVAPAAPAALGGRLEDNDDGILNAWLPDVELRERGRVLCMRDAARASEHTYELCAGDAGRSHDPETCAACAAAAVAEAEGVAEREGAATRDQPRILADSDSDEEVARAREDANAALGADADVDSLVADVLAGSDAMSADDYSAQNSEQPLLNNTCRGIRDVVITGETLPRHGQAWHHYRFYGRVRAWDGLVALVRVPAHSPQLGVYIFRGYVVAGNFVGSWRLRTNNARAVPVEGPFALSKV